MARFYLRRKPLCSLFITMLVKDTWGREMANGIKSLFVDDLTGHHAFMLEGWDHLVKWSIPAYKVHDTCKVQCNRCEQWMWMHRSSTAVSWAPPGMHVTVWLCADAWNGFCCPWVSILVDLEDCCSSSTESMQQLLLQSQQPKLEQLIRPHLLRNY